MTDQLRWGIRCAARLEDSELAVPATGLAAELAEPHHVWEGRQRAGARMRRFEACGA
jgi:hypothetical protein